LYYSPGACHAPHHAPKEWVEKFKGRFDVGYEAIREQTLARQKEIGLVLADTELPPINPIGTPETRTGPDGQPFPALDHTRPWDSLNDDEKRLFARMAEVYAGFLAHADHHIGRLLDYLEHTNQLENTMIVVALLPLSLVSTTTGSFQSQFPVCALLSSGALDGRKRPSRQSRVWRFAKPEASSGQRPAFVLARVWPSTVPPRLPRFASGSLGLGSSSATLLPLPAVRGG